MPRRILSRDLTAGGWRGLQRVARQLGRWLLLLAGLIVTPMPMPVGLLMITIALAILVEDSHRVRWAVTALRRRSPTLSRQLRRARERSPRGVQGIIDRTDPDECR